jgi:hypothetical protein
VIVSKKETIDKLGKTTLSSPYGGRREEKFLFLPLLCKLHYKGSTITFLGDF